MNKNIKIILIIIVLFCIALIYRFISFADTNISGEIMFSNYTQLGDTLEVINAPSKTKYTWTVYSIIDGKNIKTETNSTGKFKVKSEYAESYIKCELSSGEVLQMYASNLPVMYIDSKTKYNEILKEEYSDVNIKLTGNSKYKELSYLYNGTGKIKLRGHSSADREKKPFRIKLDNSSNLLNLGMEDNKKVYKSKHWVLLADDIDHTLMRNKLFYDFSGDIDFEYYFKSTSIALVYNGKYMGTYLLCEHRRVDEGRVNITDWTSLAETISKKIASVEWEETSFKDEKEMEDLLYEEMSTNYSWMDNKTVTLNNKTYKFSNYDIKIPNTNGGFFAEIDFRTEGVNNAVNIETAYGIPIYISAPSIDEDNENIDSLVKNFKKTAFYNSTKNYIQSFEYALHSKNFVFNSGVHNKVENDGTFMAANGWKSKLTTVTYEDKENENKHYSEFFDIDSLVNNLLFNEITNNFDSMKTSAFFYKDVDELAMMGPVWDLDMSLGNITMWNHDLWYPTKWQITNEYFTHQYSYQSYNWYRLLIKDPYFLIKTYERYKEIRPVIENLIKDGGTLDQYKEYIYKAGLANDTVWGYTYNPKYYSGAQPLYFEDSVKRMKNFLEIRINWLDEQFKTIESLIKSFGYYKATSDLEYKYNGEYLWVKSTNINCKNVDIQINGKYLITSKITNGEAYIEIPKKYLNTNNDYNVIIVYEKDEKGFIIHKFLKPSNNYEHIASSVYFYFKTKDQFVDKSELKKEIEVVYNKVNYTNESWNAFNDIYQNAKKTFDNKKSMQSDIDKMLSELKQAKLKLVNIQQNEKEQKPNIDEINTPSEEITNTSSDDNNIDSSKDDSLINKDTINNDENNIKKDSNFFICLLILCTIGIISGVVILILKNKKKTSV